MRKIFKIVLLTVLAVFIFVIVYLLTSYLNYISPDSNIYSSTNNAMWVGHTWVGDKHSTGEIRDLANKLKQKQITDIFVHSGPLDEDGLIDPQKYKYAANFLTEIHKYYSDLRVQAWLGQVEKRGGGRLDLSSEEVRNNIVETARKFRELEFDGIHYNIEPIYSGDKDFLDLISKTKKAINPCPMCASIKNSRYMYLSVASDELELFPGAEKLVRPFVKQAGFWNKQYYLDVFQHVDQVAVMMYDTALPFDWLYANLVSWQTNNLISTISDKHQLFMGVPTYDDRRWSFDSKAENMESGLRGVQKGLQRYSKNQLSNFGVAIYADWTTDENEWKIYNRYWLGQD